MTIEKMLRFVALAGVFALPFVALVVSSSLFFPYITGKNFAFRIIVEISAAAWLALALVNPTYRPRKSWVLAALAAFVLVIGVADVFGAYPFKSIWSNFERMDGWMTIAHLLLYSITVAGMLQTEKLWRYLWWTTLGVSVYLSLYGLLQVTGQIALGQGGAGGLTGRIDATFGNPIYFAAYMLFHVFIAAMLWTEAWIERGHGKRVSISLIYGSIIVLDTAALLLTGTRGTILGLVGGAIAAAFLTLIQARNSRSAWRFSAGMVAGLVVLVGAFFFVKDQAWIQKIGFLDRLATISLDDATTKARFVNWSMAWKGIQERPVLGWGQENYALVFDRYYDPRMYGQEPWFDRVHNIIFDWWVAGGTLGLLAYLAIFGIALLALWRPSVKRGSTEVSAPNVRGAGFSIAERSILTGLLAGYFVHNFFVFDNVTSYILFGTVLAFIAYRSSKARDTAYPFAAHSVAKTHLPYVALGVTVLLLLSAWFVNQKPLEANRLLLQAIASQSDASKMLGYFRDSIAIGAYGTQEAREQLAQAAANAAGSGIPNDLKQEYLDAAVAEMTKQAAESPLDARFPLFLGTVYAAYGLHAEATSAYEKALELSPQKQSIMFLLGESATTQGDNAAALAFFKKAYELDTSFKMATILYASALIRAGENQEAQQLLAPLIESGEAADTRLLAAYRATNQLSRAIPVWEAALRARPQDVQLYFTLAAIHYLAGNRSQAIQVLEDGKRAIPGLAQQADPVIEQIRNGTAKVE